MTGSGFFGIPQIHKPRSMAMFTGHGAFFWDRLKHDGFNLDIYRIQKTVNAAVNIPKP
jgi:hypothetical protein